MGSSTGVCVHRLDAHGRVLPHGGSVGRAHKGGREEPPPVSTPSPAA